MNNKVHREVELQSKLKVVISLVASLFGGEGDIQRALTVINDTAGASSQLGFWRRITGTGTILGNVMILDLDVPLMDSTTGRGYESKFNASLARALTSEFGRLNVGYVSPEPVTVRVVRVETDRTNAELTAILPKGSRIL
jgi:hypothetical protein